METGFEALAGNPLIGRISEEVVANLRRFEHESHVVYYQPQGGGVLMARVLHETMDASRQL